MGAKQLEGSPSLAGLSSVANGNKAALADCKCGAGGFALAAVAACSVSKRTFTMIFRMPGNASPMKHGRFWVVVPLPLSASGNHGTSVQPAGENGATGLAGCFSGAVVNAWR
jgi:hypothetical protein